MTDKTDRVSRSAIERVLQELSGFKADAAEIDRIMVIIDAYVMDQMETVNYAPAPMVESHLHLLIQQAELLLDSGQAITVRLDELERRTEQAIASEQAMETVAKLTLPAVELTQAERDTVAATLGTGHRPPNTISDEKVARLYELFDQGKSEGQAAAEVGVSRSSANKYRNTWKASRSLAAPPEDIRDIGAADKVMREARLAAAEEITKLTETWDDPPEGIRTRKGRTELYCYTCHGWKDTSHFYKNQKSKTGYETKCRECRPPKVSAA